MPQKATLGRLTAVGTLIILAVFLPEAAESVGREDPILRTRIDHAAADFPDGIEFWLAIDEILDPRRIDLEFGFDPVHSCDGGVVYSARFPGWSEVVWQWEPNPQQALPPGAVVRWRWKMTDIHGDAHVSHEGELRWTDQRFQWQTYTKDWLAVHWHDKEPEFGRNLVAYIEPQIDRIAPIAAAPGPVNIFVYADALDADPGAVLRRGQTNPYQAFNTIVSVLPEDPQVDELSVLVHGLARLIVQDRGFNCYTSLPRWLEEGLATLASGGMSSEMRLAFAQSRLIESFWALRSLDVPPGSDVPATAPWYAQSYDVVEFLIGEFGWDGMGNLIDAIGDGNTVDESFKAAYGIGIDEAERLWRESRGLPDPIPVRPNQPEM